MPVAIFIGIGVVGEDLAYQIGAKEVNKRGVVWYSEKWIQDKKFCRALIMGCQVGWKNLLPLKEGTRCIELIFVHIIIYE